ncbi:DgyrCDS6074 [Dimorphilus gyrociliatus]|uniref:DgyrCDS6074 n=1 Tax=Dimorphilus gyrociliatus TaxID=2664684 RepID=A0A7I8VNI1_9ANNE|nr:DgyrCDS6074 [Dimorphilus gyrociliatus]
MPPKRGKSGERKGGQDGDAAWETKLANTVFSEETEDGWIATIACLVGNRYEDYALINSIEDTIRSKSRRLFSTFSKSELYNESVEFGSSKGKKGKDAPQFVEVYEYCKEYLDNNEEVPLQVQAKLIKAKLLAIKKEDHARREVERKWREERERRRAGQSDGDGKKGKKDRGKSPKGKVGKKTPEPSAPKNESKLQKRGEEDLDSKYIDDEPDDGSKHYIVIHGFNHPHLFSFLSEIGIHVDVIYKVKMDDYSRFDKSEDEIVEEKTEKQLLVEEEERKRLEALTRELDMFWRDITPVLQMSSASPKLHDLPILPFDINSASIPIDFQNSDKKAEVSSSLFEKLACDTYDLLDWKRQWRNFIENLKLYHVPGVSSAALANDSPGTAAPTPAPTSAPPIVDDLSSDVDMRYYKDLMDCIPHESVSVPLIVNCMVEQVAATAEHRLPPSAETKLPRADGLCDSLADHLNRLASNMALDPNEVRALSSEYEIPDKKLDGNRHPLLINYSDEAKTRLRNLQTNIDLFNPLQTESYMNTRFPTNTLLAPPESPPEKAKLKRISRLQELLTFCSTPGISKNEVDIILRQFVFECLRSTEVDENGQVVKFYGKNLIPWDDPYPYYHGILGIFNIEEEDKFPVTPVRQESVEVPTTRPESRLSEKSSSGESAEISTQKSSKKERKSRSKSKRGKNSADKAVRVTEEPVEVVPPPSPKETGGILKDSKRPRSSSSRDSSVHFERDDIGLTVSHPGDEFETIDQASILDRLSDIVEAQRRNLDQWTFVEQLDINVLHQVIKEASYTLPYMDTLYSRRDNKLLVMLSNPYDKKLLANYDKWESHSHTDVHFRNYLEHVAWRIEEWITAEEAKYEATKTAKESALFQKEFEELEAAKAREANAENDKKKKKDRSKSPKRKKADDSSRSSTPEDSEPFVRQNSIKAYLKDKEREFAEEEEKKKALEEKRANSAKKRKEAEKEEKGKRSKSPRSSAKSRKSRRETEVVTPAGGQEQVPTDNYFSFEGYDLGDEMLAASGITYNMFPSDGSLIRTNITEFVEGSKTVHTALIKDKHQLLVHIINPKDVVITPFSEDDVKEKSETEKPEKETAETEITEKHSSQTEAELRKPLKPIVGEYASFSATLADGICLAFSTYGKTGRVDGGEIYKPEPYVTPHIRTPTPTAPVGGKESVASKKKAKGTKEKKEDSEPPPMRAIGTPASSSNVLDGERKSVKTENYEECSFLKLQFSTPSGLVVTFLKRDDSIVVQQQYAFKTKEIEPCKEISDIAGNEEKRMYSSDGSLLIFSNNPTATKILYPDGKMTEYSTTIVPNDKAVGSRNTSPQRGTSPKDAPKRAGRRKHSPKIEDEVAETVTREKWYSVQPTGERLITIKEGENTENIPIDPLLKCECFDPSSNQVMITRDDKTIIVKHADGTIISEHPDGTRFTTYSHEDKNSGKITKLIKIENPAYCTVTFDSSSGECHVETASRTIINAFPAGNYELHHADGSFMRIEQNGGVSFSPKPNDFQLANPQQPLIYHMRHDADVILYSVDNNGNRFSVRNTGLSSATLVEKTATAPRSSEEDTIMTMENRTPSLTAPEEKDESEGRKINIECYDEHAPRFFVINPDGRSGMELLRYQEVAEWITNAEADPFTAIIVDQVADRPKISSISTLIPFTKSVSQRWIKSYDDNSIVPPGLTLRDLTTFPPQEEKTMGPGFGTNAGRGLEIGSREAPCLSPLPKCPDTLQIRQVLQYTALTPEIREEFSNGIKSYADFVVSRFKDTQTVGIEEYRSESEQLMADTLLEDSGTVHLIEDRQSVTSLIEEREDQQNTFRIESSNVRSVYERSTAPKVPSPIPPPLPKRTAEDWEQDKKELEKEMEHRKVLRNKYVPPYFQSQFGKSYLDSLESKNNKDEEESESVEPKKVAAPPEEEKSAPAGYEEETPSPNQELLFACDSAENGKLSKFSDCCLQLHTTFLISFF